MTLKPHQIKANPKNPRFIRDANFKRLVESIKHFPEMTEVREIVVNKDHMILGGNMRFRAMKEAGWQDIPVKIVDWPEDKQTEFMIKDNANAGEWEWEILANQFDHEVLKSWGVNTAFLDRDDADLTNEQDEWVNMPDYGEADDRYKLIVNFADQQDRDKFVALHDIQISTKGEKAFSTWWPYKEKDDLKDMQIQ